MVLNGNQEETNPPLDRPQDTREKGHSKTGIIPCKSKRDGCLGSMCCMPPKNREGSVGDSRTREESEEADGRGPENENSNHLLGNRSMGLTFKAHLPLTVCRTLKKGGRVVYSWFPFKQTSEKVSFKLEAKKFPSSI